MTIARNSLPGLNRGNTFCGTETASPVFGFLPARERRSDNEKLPKSRISIRLPAVSAAVMAPKISETDASASTSLSSGKRRAILDMSSDLVTGAMLPFRDLYKTSVDR